MKAMLVAAVTFLVAVVSWVSARLAQTQTCKNNEQQDRFREIVHDHIGPPYWAAFERYLREANISQMSPEAVSHLLSDLHNRSWEEAVKHFEDAYRFAGIMTGKFPEYQRLLMVVWAQYAEEASQRFTFIHPIVSCISGAQELSEVANNLTKEV